MKNSGFTLIELMVVVSILAVLAMFALPAYQSYVVTSQEGVLVSNIHTIEMFQEDFFLRNGEYAVDLANIAAIEAAIGWDPQSEDGITYSIADGDGTTYQVTGINPDGITVCVDFPDKDRC